MLTSSTSTKWVARSCGGSGGCFLIPATLARNGSAVAKKRSANVEKLDAKVMAEARDTAREYVEYHGSKNGMYLLGRILGCERRAKGILYGEPESITAGEYLALRQAQNTLRKQQHMRHLARAAEIEKLLGNSDEQAVMDFGPAVALGRPAR